MRGELTQEHTRTEGSCMRVVGTSCMRNFWRRHGKRRWMNGANVPRPSSPSGSERGRERSPETRSLQTTKTRDRLRLLLVLRKKRKRRRKRTKRRRRRNKDSPVAAGNTQTSSLKTTFTTISNLARNSTKDAQSQSSKYFRQNFTNNSRNHDKSKLYTSSLNYDLCFQTNSLLFFFNLGNFSIVTNNFLNFVFV